MQVFSQCVARLGQSLPITVRVVASAWPLLFVLSAGACTGAVTGTPAPGADPAAALASGGAGTSPVNGGGAPGSAAVDPLAIIGKGILDCPAVAPPAYTLVPKGGSLSMRFQSTCASCHGPAGAGRPGYPALPSGLSLDEFKSTVRMGKGLNMPAFDATSISDAEIQSDYRILSQGADPSATSTTTGRTSPDTWTTDKRDQVLARGLTLLRKPDKYGTACANCHSPDAIELGVIAFTDDDVMRRGLQHLPPDDVLDLVDYVHALRSKYDIQKTCSKLWRPFQPGGDPLPGATVQEREVAFAAELEKRNLLIYTKPIASFEDAKAAADELEQVSLRTLPVGVTFPRWSEDAFDGPEHKSFNDWMPGGGRVPIDPARWYALHDQYLADPSIANLSKIEGALEAATTLSKADSHGREISANFSADYNAQGWMEDVLFLKHQSVLLGSHFFRLALLEQPGWFERPALPFPELPHAIGPFFHQGLINAEAYCYSDETCNQQITAALPAFMKEEFGPDETVSHMQQRVLSDAWSYLGQLEDASLLTAENFRGPTQDGHYWNLFTFEHVMLQQPFFSAHRLITQQAYATKYRGTDKYPAALDSAAHAGGPENPLTPLPDTTTPMLHGDWTDVQGIAGTTDFGVDRTDPRLGPSLFLRANEALMILYLQRDLLEHGATVGNRAKLLDNIGAYQGTAKLLSLALEDSAWARQNPKLQSNTQTLVDDLGRLLTEVTGLIDAATESDPGGGF